MNAKVYLQIAMPYPKVSRFQDVKITKITYSYAQSRLEKIISTMFLSMLHCGKVKFLILKIKKHLRPKPVAKYS